MYKPAPGKATEQSGGGPQGFSAARESRPEKKFRSHPETVPAECQLVQHLPLGRTGKAENEGRARKSRETNRLRRFSHQACRGLKSPATLSDNRLKPAVVRIHFSGSSSKVALEFIPGRWSSDPQKPRVTPVNKIAVAAKFQQSWGHSSSGTIPDCFRWRPAHGGGVKSAAAFPHLPQQAKPALPRLTTGRISPAPASVDETRSLLSGESRRSSLKSLSRKQVEALPYVVEPFGVGSTRSRSQPVFISVGRGFQSAQVPRRKGNARSTKGLFGPSIFTNFRTGNIPRGELPERAQDNSFWLHRRNR